ncbi:MAG: N-acetyltransferase [Acidiferrobacterales bacterium]|nr:N-acetyltransferase [Acidiferrobacterales bacterium]
MSAILVREATNEDRADVYKIYLDAFSTGENQQVGNLAISLLDNQSQEDTFALIAEYRKEITGHIAFSKLTANLKDWTGFILSPLAVGSKFQRQGVGSKLIHEGIKILKEKSVNHVFVYGDPAYYGKFSFKTDQAALFVPPYKLEYPFGWQVKDVISYSSDIDEVNLNCVKALQDPNLW